MINKKCVHLCAALNVVRAINLNRKDEVKCFYIIILKKKENLF